MQLQGIRSAGSDIPGTEPPVIPGAIHLTREQESQILGGEACMWAEIANPETVDGRIWPRMAAIAERLWSPVESTQDEADMYLRLAATSDWLVWTGIRHRANYLPMLQRMTTGDIEPLCTLAEIVEPIKFYARHGTRTYSQFTPLNRLVDAVPAESDKARAFAIMVDALLADSQRETHRTVIQTWLTSWRDNHARLAPLLGASFLLQPLEPLSEDLTQVAELGLESLQAFVDGRAPTEEQRQRGLALLERAAQPCDELLLAIVPAVRRLVGG
jgi:hexosaminidase